MIKYPRRNINRTLRVGQIIEFQGQPFEVLRVTESNAAVRPLAKREVIMKTIGEKTIKFTAPLKTEYISAESEVMILAPNREGYKP